MQSLSITILMPCLNEVKTLPGCIQSAQELLRISGWNGQILVADNGSTDGSIEYCRSHHIPCIQVAERGYGAALHAGILAAQTTHVLFADADGSYAFNQALPMLKALQEGADLVVGNRFEGGIEKGAMPLLHRYFGTPVISMLGRQSFRVPIHDFNCGMRGLSRNAYSSLNMQSTGMEYATEMIARAAHAGLRIEEVPIPLYRDQRDRKPHLKTWQDGWRHFRLILLLSPKWLLLFPAIFFLAIGLCLGGALLFSTLKIQQVYLDIHTLYFCSVFLLLAFTFFQFYYLAMVVGASMGLYPLRGLSGWISRSLSFEKGIGIGLLLFLLGLGLSGYAVWTWAEKQFQALNPSETFRIVIPGGFCMIVGLQFLVFSFLITMLQQKKVAI